MMEIATPWHPNLYVNRTRESDNHLEWPCVLDQRKLVGVQRCATKLVLSLRDDSYVH